MLCRCLAAKGLQDTLVGSPIAPVGWDCRIKFARRSSRSRTCNSATSPLKRASTSDNALRYSNRMERCETFPAALADNRAAGPFPHLPIHSCRGFQACFDLPKIRAMRAIAQPLPVYQCMRRHTNAWRTSLRKHRIREQSHRALKSCQRASCLSLESATLCRRAIGAPRNSRHHFN